MARLSSLLLGAAIIGIGLGAAPHARADLLNFGTSYSLGWNFGDTGGNATAYSANLTLQSAAQSFTGAQAYQITENTTPLGGGKEFVEFYVTTANGSPLVPNGSANGNGFAIYMNGVQLNQTATESNYYFNFVTNGSVNTGITPWSGLGVESNPNPGSLGAGQNAFYFPSSSPYTGNPVGYGEYQYPFDYSVGQMTIDPNATGYVFGFELTPAPAPAPGTGVFGLVALMLAGVVARPRGLFAR